MKHSCFLSISWRFWSEILEYSYHECNLGTQRRLIEHNQMWMVCGLQINEFKYIWRVGYVWKTKFITIFDIRSLLHRVDGPTKLTLMIIKKVLDFGVEGNVFHCLVWRFLSYLCSMSTLNCHYRQSSIIIWLLQSLTTPIKTCLASSDGLMDLKYENE